VGLSHSCPSLLSHSNFFLLYTVPLCPSYFTHTHKRDVPSTTPYLEVLRKRPFKWDTGTLSMISIAYLEKQTGTRLGHYWDSGPAHVCL
jgi:hypothetical protein